MTTDSRPVVSRTEWLKERIRLLELEKDLFRQKDEVAAQRRALPWVKVTRNYRGAVTINIEITRRPSSLRYAQKARSSQ